MIKYLTIVRQRERPPLTHKPFLDLIVDFAKKIEETVITDVRFALTGEQNTEAPADSGSKSEKKEQ